MGQLMADDAEGLGETLKDFAVAVTEDHLGAVPEGVVVQLAEVHGGVQGQTPAVDGVPAEDVRVEPVRMAKPVIGLVSGRISRSGLTLLADKFARKNF